jgi:cytochrome c oxidase subunit 2
VGIAIWGFTGVDWEVLNQGTGPESIAAAGLADSENNLADSGSRDATPESAISRGQAVFEANGCNACHSIDGSKKIGPSLKGVWGMEQVHVDGSTAIMDVDYFNESVLEPQARIIEGYGSAMPSYQDLVTPEQLADLAAYVESLE